MSARRTSCKLRTLAPTSQNSEVEFSEQRQHGVNLHRFAQRIVQECHANCEPCCAMMFFLFCRLERRMYGKQSKRDRQSASPGRLAACNKKCEEPPSKKSCVSPPCTSKRPLVTTSENHPYTSNQSRRKKTVSPYREGCAHSLPSLLLIMGGPVK